MPRRAYSKGAVPSFAVQHAIDTIQGNYGDTVVIKPKILNKFGKTLNADSGVETTIMELQGSERLETYATGNDIDRISSSSASDTEEMVVEGHTLSGSDLTFVTQTVTLNGQTPVALTTPMYRANRLYNNGSTDLVGNIFVFENVATTNGTPNTAANTKLMISAGFNQSRKAATSISSQDYWIITSADLSLRSGNKTASADISIQTRLFGKVFREGINQSIVGDAASSFTRFFDPPLIVPKNSDFRVNATSDVADTEINCSINGYLATTA